MSDHTTENTGSPLAIVVGGAGAIGAAIVDRLRQNDRRVVVLDMRPPSDPTVPYFNVDVTVPDSVDDALAAVVSEYRSPDSLICASGYLSGAKVLDLTPDDLRQHLEINVFGTVFLSQKVARLMMPAGGKILFVTSIHGQIGVPNRAAYAMSKAALGAWTRAMAVELAPHHIRVNALAPGAVNGGITPDAGTRSYWQSETPSGRVASLTEIARFAALLTSDDASFITGQTIAIDGGASNLRPYGLAVPVRS